MSTVLTTSVPGSGVVAGTPPSASRTDPQGGQGDIGGLTGVVLDLVDRLGEWGVGLALFVETVFPPIPSEVILPLAGFLAGAGSMDLGLVLLSATIGSTVGALALYWVGAAVGLDRSVRMLGRLPLVDEDDLRRAAGWFAHHGRAAVLFGRLVPGVRSLVSLPAGADRMPLGAFTLCTVVGSGVWNTALVLVGAALGTRYELIEAWSGWIDRVVYLGIAGVVAVFVVRRLRRRARDRAAADPGDRPPVTPS